MFGFARKIDKSKEEQPYQLMAVNYHDVQLSQLANITAALWTPEAHNENNGKKDELSR